MADFMMYLIETSGLKERIAEIVKDAIAENMSSNISMQKKHVDSTEESPYYTRAELCQLAHITESTLWRLEKAGIIKKIKLGRKNLYSRLDIDALLGSGEFHYSSKNHLGKKGGNNHEK